MNKVDEILEKSITEMEGKFHPYYIDGYGDGFDAAMDLQLPVKFLKWIVKGKYYHKGEFIAPWDAYAVYTEQEMFDYFIANIYIPESVTKK